jgi:hypothetical protein
LGQHGAGGVVHRGEQMGLPAVASGAPQRLAVECDRPSALARTVTVGKPRADRGGQGLGVKPGEGPADRGFGRHHPAVGGIAAGAERGTDWLRGVRGPLGDRGDRPGAGQDRSGGHGQDRDQRVAPACACSRVTDGGEVGEQTRRFGWPEGRRGRVG